MESIIEMIKLLRRKKQELEKKLEQQNEEYNSISSQLKIIEKSDISRKDISIHYNSLVESLMTLQQEMSSNRENIKIAEELLIYMESLLYNELIPIDLRKQFLTMNSKERKDYIIKNLIISKYSSNNAKYIELLIELPYETIENIIKLINQKKLNTYYLHNEYNLNYEQTNAIQKISELNESLQNSFFQELFLCKKEYDNYQYIIDINPKEYVTKACRNLEPLKEELDLVVNKKNRLNFRKSNCINASSAISKVRKQINAIKRYEKVFKKIQKLSILHEEQYEYMDYYLDLFDLIDESIKEIKDRIKIGAIGSKNLLTKYLVVTKTEDDEENYTHIKEILDKDEIEDYLDALYDLRDSIHYDYLKSLAIQTKSDNIYRSINKYLDLDNDLPIKESLLEYLSIFDLNYKTENNSIPSVEELLKIAYNQLLNSFKSFVKDDNLFKKFERRKSNITYDDILELISLLEKYIQEEETDIEISDKEVDVQFKEIIEKAERSMKVIEIIDENLYYEMTFKEEDPFHCAKVFWKKI